MAVRAEDRRPCSAGGAGAQSCPGGAATGPYASGEGDRRNETHDHPWARGATTVGAVNARAAAGASGEKDRRRYRDPHHHRWPRQRGNDCRVRTTNPHVSSAASAVLTASGQCNLSQTFPSTKMLTKSTQSLLSIALSFVLGSAGNTETFAADSWYRSTPSRRAPSDVFRGVVAKW